MNFRLFWALFLKAARIRYWTTRQAFMEIWRRIRKKERGMLTPRVLWDEFILPFFNGHLPITYHVSAIDAGYNLKEMPFASVDSIQERVSKSIADFILGPYERTGVLPRYAQVLWEHYFECDYCKAVTLREYGGLQKLAWLINRASKENRESIN